MGTSRRELIQFVSDRPGHDWRYDINPGKIKRELGWKPRHDLTEGLLATIQWYLTRPDWVTSIRERREYQNWLDVNYDKRETKK